MSKKRSGNQTGSGLGLIGRISHRDLLGLAGECMTVIGRPVSSPVAKHSAVLDICISPEGINVKRGGKSLSKEKLSPSQFRHIVDSGKRRGIIGFSEVVHLKEFEVVVKTTVKNPTRKEMGILDVLDVLDGKIKLPKKAKIVEEAPTKNTVAAAA